MALFFDLKKLEEQSCNDSVKLISMLYFHWNKNAPILKHNIPLRSRVSLAGYSFLLNPADFFNDRGTELTFRIQYIKLAARRDYLLYKQYGYKGLQTSFFPDLAMDNIKHNPLLNIKPTEILFKFE